MRMFFFKKLIKSGAKPSITGDLWSDGGMGLFGVCAHGINNDDWTNDKILIGLYACAEDRHTALNIEEWTTEVLEDMGLKLEDLAKATLELEAEDIDDNQGLLVTQEDLDRLGVDTNMDDANNLVSKKVSDNGANIKKAWGGGVDDDDGDNRDKWDGQWVGCFDHTLELCATPMCHKNCTKKGGEDMNKVTQTGKCVCFNTQQCAATQFLLSHLSRFLSVSHSQAVQKTLTEKLRT